MKRILRYLLGLSIFLAIVSFGESQHVNQEKIATGFTLRLKIEDSERIAEDIKIAITNSSDNRLRDGFRIDKVVDDNPLETMTFSGAIYNNAEGNFIVKYQLNSTIAINVTPNNEKANVQYKNEGTNSSVILELGKETEIIKDLDTTITLTLNRIENQ